MKKFIRLQSTRNITVTPGLLNIEMTNPNAHVADRLRVASVWTQFCVKIHTGVGYYPAQIKDWGSVKALVEDGVFTLGEETDDCQGDPGAAEAEEMYNKLKEAERRAKSTARKAKADAGLQTNDLSEEDMANIGNLKDN